MRSADLIPYAFNNRKHPEQQIDRIANSIKEFGFNQPIVIDESNVVLVGHGRLAAALKLGLQEVPVVKIESLSEAKKKAYRILDNKLQNDSEWDFANVELELGQLEDLGFDKEEWGLETILPDSKSFEVNELSEEQISAMETSFKIEIECFNETTQKELFERFEAEGLKCRLLTL